MPVNVITKPVRLSDTGELTLPLIHTAPPSPAAELPTKEAVSMVTLALDEAYTVVL